ARVRAEEVDRPEALLGRIDQCEQVGLPGDVARDRETWHRGAGDLAGELVDARFLAVGVDAPARLLRREPPRQRGADAARGTRHDDAFPGELHVITAPSSSMSSTSARPTVGSAA